MCCVFRMMSFGKVASIYDDCQVKLFWDEVRPIKFIQLSDAQMYVALSQIYYIIQTYPMALMKLSALVVVAAVAEIGHRWVTDYCFRVRRTHSSFSIGPATLWCYHANLGCTSSVSFRVVRKSSGPTVNRTGEPLDDICRYRSEPVQ